MTESPSHRDRILREVPVRRVPTCGDRRTHAVIREELLTVMLNGRQLIRMSCLPDALEDLVLGFLVSEGLVDSAEAVSDVTVSDARDTVSVRARVDPYRLVGFRQRLAMSSGCGGGASCVSEQLPPCASRARFRPEQISERMVELQHASDVFRETGGVHCSAATDGEKLLAFAEDIGRHNAVDKTLGRCVREGVDLGSMAILTTGRLSADILSKAIRAGVPVVVSRGAATSRAIELAAAADVAAVGFARARDMNVYTAAWRLGLDAP
ncbi:MAG TPA: formate dehydrogenase accessory sulfurtransferase FdhD [Planctomycetota bacterium]|nr:formate dehydrogenase accessory sulfurtransferase FdhD [Planctomycetota bacterium]